MNTVHYEEGADEYFSADNLYTPFGKTQYPSLMKSQKEKQKDKVHDVNGYPSENTSFNENYYHKFRPGNSFDINNFKTESKSFRNTQREGAKRKPGPGAQNKESFQNTDFHDSYIPSFKETDLRNPSFDIASFRPSSFATF